MEETSQTSCLPYHDVTQQQPGTLVRKGKQCAFCAFVCCVYALNVQYVSVFMLKMKRRLPVNVGTAGCVQFRH